MRLSGKVAIVTGGSSGIGRATAELFAREGAKVLVADCNAPQGRETVKSIRHSGQDARFFEVDVSKADQVNRMVSTSIDAWGGVDICFNGAGILYYGTAIETDEATWNQVIGVNLTGTFLCCKAVLPRMIDRGGGSIINVCSTTGAHGACARAVAYVSSKGGVGFLTKSLAIDHAKDNVRVNALCPGPTDTPMLRRNLSPEQLEAFTNTFPMNRMGRPMELAQAALFLASESASFVTGAMLMVDGGQTAGV